MDTHFKQELLAAAVGVLVGGLGMNMVLANSGQTLFPGAQETVSEEYHIHADFLIQTRDIIHELGVAELMTTREQELHKHAHLHDDNGDVLHMHHENISFVEFLDSINISLMEDCLTIDLETYCTNETESLVLFVNGERWPHSLKDYVPQDLDRVLLYFGTLEETPINTYLEAVPDEACIYSGSCPERGIAPPESCGLTCEL